MQKKLLIYFIFIFIATSLLLFKSAGIFLADTEDVYWGEINFFGMSKDDVIQALISREDGKINSDNSEYNLITIYKDACDIQKRFSSLDEVKKDYEIYNSSYWDLNFKSTTSGVYFQRIYFENNKVFKQDTFKRGDLLYFESLKSKYN